MTLQPVLKATNAVASPPSALPRGSYSLLNLVSLFPLTAAGYVNITRNQSGHH